MINDINDMKYYQINFVINKTYFNIFSILKVATL